MKEFVRRNRHYLAAAALTAVILTPTFRYAGNLLWREAIAAGLAPSS
jgi:hypothetical protein